MPIPKGVDEPATAKQINYINILSNNLQLSKEQRDSWIATIINRTPQLMDLSKIEASNVIGAFKRRWENIKLDNEYEERMNDDIEDPF